jgi:hypothetical protein
LEVKSRDFQKFTLSRQKRTLKKREISKKNSGFGLIKNERWGERGVFLMTLNIAISSSILRIKPKRMIIFEKTRERKKRISVRKSVRKSKIATVIK